MFLRHPRHSPVRRETRTRTKACEVIRFPACLFFVCFPTAHIFLHHRLTQAHHTGVSAGPNGNKQTIQYKRYIKLLSEARGRGLSHCQSCWEGLLSSQSDCAGESLTFHMTFCHFASDILNMLSLTFVSGFVCRLQNKSRDAAGNTKGANKRGGGETEINKIGPE